MPCLPHKEICRLVTRAQAGDDTAFTKLYQATAEAQYFSAISILKEPALAEDSIQTVYLQVYKNIGRLTIPEHFLAWLTRITYNTSLNLLKNKRRAITELNENDEEDLTVLPDPHPDVNPLGSTIQQEDRDFLLSLLNELSMEHRTILVMRYYQELKVREIAEIMGLSEGTVKSRIHYGLKRLRENLKAHGFHGADSVLGAGVFLRHSFRSASADLPGSGFRKHGNDCVKIVTACTAAGLLLVGAAKALPASEIREVAVSSPDAFTRKDVTVLITASVKEASQLKAFYVNGEDIPIIQKSSQHFSLQAGRNGKIRVCLQDRDGIKEEKEIEITQIDSDKPVMLRYENDKDVFRAYFSDEGSGTDFDTAKAFVNDSPVRITKIDEGEGYVEFPCSRHDSVRLSLKDRAGNSASFELEAVERSTVLP